MGQNKQTPTPWIFNQEEMKIKGSGDYDGRTIIANVSTKMDFTRGMSTQCANAARIVECVNALAGIKDPQQFVKDAIEASVIIIELKQQLKNAQNGNK